MTYARFCDGGADCGKAFLLTERGVLVEWTDAG